ncbi:MAG: single-stranded-DNA-specific exonuclease RecJ, partial [Bacilli bacterium]|nr:single-stranded-DNA-specific exonuclease RecJ [Bacilli bacterium]
MLDAKYVWNVKANGIVSDSEIYKVILANRGIDDGEKFFSMGEESLHDPYLIEGMERAVSRVIKAISANEKILIYGDYDCDGISAITVMVRALSRLNANVGYDLPDRFQDGYGLNMKAVDKIIKNKVNLVITVDNGITCVEEVAALKAAGIDTIITDHHEGKEVLPDAYQILHAKLSSNYPFREIAGVMIAYKFASAIANDKLTDLYDLVMIGTIADLMPLEDENQAMVNLGLKQLKHTKIPGLRKLVEFSHLDIINETAIAFKIAPKINSSGRMGRALQAVRLLVTDSEREVNELILQIEENHASRKDLTESAVKLCELLVDPQDEVLVIASKDLHEGVIGICAQKLAEKYQKTTVVITIDEAGVGKGSARAFGDENILEMLENNRDLLIRFGGHQQAAGLQIAEPDIEKLRKNMNLVSNRQEAPILQVDMQVRINEVRIETVKKLQDLSFFTATFLFAELEIVKKQLLNNKHVKLTVASEGKTFDVLAFNNTEYYYSLEIGDLIDVVGGMNLNTWKSRISLQV